MASTIQGVSEDGAGDALIGRKAPPFSLKRQDDTPVKLADLKGQWVVLYFYPKDDTPGCTTEACEFTSGVKGFEKMNAVVFGCSPDSTESHRKFIAKHKLKISLLSDPERTTLQAYGAWGEKKLYGRSIVGVLRSTVIINPEGKIAHRWARVKTAGHAEQVRDTLATLQAAAA